MKGRVILVEDNRGDARLIREMLVETRSEFTLEWAGTLAEGIERLESDKADLVLLDLGLPDSQGLDSARRIRETDGEVPIVIVSGLAEESLAISAVHEGAQDYLLKGRITPDVLVHSMQYAIERQRAHLQQLRMAERRPDEPRARGKILSFIGAKGGVGTTSVALNVAVSLAERGLSVTLAEIMGYRGLLSVLLSIAPPSNLSLLARENHELITAATVERTLYRYSTGLRILFSPQSVEEYGELKPESVQGILTALTELVDWVVVDVPSYPTAPTEAAVRRSDYTVLVADREPSCIAFAHDKMHLLETWGVPGAKQGVLVVNRSVLADPVELSEIRDQVGLMIGTIPPAADDFATAGRQSMPLVVVRPETAAAAAFAELAARLASGSSAGMTMRQ